MDTLRFSTKAHNLSNLAGKLSNAKVLPQLCMTYQQWLQTGQSLGKNPNLPTWIDGNVIVRSSAYNEDGHLGSMAGKFLSIANVSGLDAIDNAIGRVFASFESTDADNQVFIQPMLNNVRFSGVGFSRDPKNAGHYYVINYDDTSGALDTVTNGSTNDLSVYIQAKSTSCNGLSDFKSVIKLLEELERLFQHDALDIEFAIDGDATLYLLQVRPLVFQVAATLSLDKHALLLDSISSTVARLSKRHPFLLGDKGVFGIMPDWNPAEIIGVRPHPLALSTYKELITDSVWAYQRNNYGYRNLRSFPLLISFEGLPFIDVRVSFNSFVPANIEHGLAEKLVNYYIDRLIENPNHHDKVEFEVIYSCYTLDLDERLNLLRLQGFTDSDCNAIANSLRELTNKIIHEDGLWKVDIGKLHKLQDRREKLLDSDLSAIEKAYWLLEDCKRYGTLPFAGLARAGFIAVQLLKSLVASGVFSEHNYEDFMGSLNTVSSIMSKDLKSLEHHEFLSKYGHLRPGTYDITSSRYDEAAGQYFDINSQTNIIEEKNSAFKVGSKQPFSLSLEQMNLLDDLLKLHQIEHGVISFLNFIKAAIEGRELAKFVFTKSLSDVLRILENAGRQINISREDMAFADIGVVRQLYSSSGNLESILRRSIEEGKANFEVTKQINLPPLITKPSDVYYFTLPINAPNFITLNAVSGRVVHSDSNNDQLTGNILMIPSADPGYDWIFSHNIGGFITMYGGMNSHMAIRAGELGIPAVIGAGEQLFQKWAAAKTLEIDCAKQRVTVLK